MGALPGFILCATYAISHRKKSIFKWEDVYVDYDKNGNRIMKPENLSEDTKFLADMQKNNGPGFRFESPTYVVCHYKFIWDC